METSSVWAGPGSQVCPTAPARIGPAGDMGCHSPSQWASPWGWGWAEAGPGHGPEGGPSSAGLVAMLDQIVGSWKLALLWHHWSRGWWPQGLKWCRGPWAGCGRDPQGQRQSGSLLPLGPGQCFKFMRIWTTFCFSQLTQSSNKEVILT